MNLDRYEKIDGWQALERFKNGEVVFSFYNHEFSEFVMAGGELYSSPLSNHAQQRTPRTMTIDVIFKRAWYIPKPFDVRQAMRDKPDEWVAAYQDEEGRWWKFGFETEAFQTLAIPFNINTKLPLYETYRKNGNWTIVLRKALDACIPIEDVPEEATR